MSDMLEGRFAVVTGGTGALGRWVVRELLTAGARVFVPYIVPDEAAQLRTWLDDAESGATNALELVEADLRDAASVEAAFTAVDTSAGALDILCNLAGGFTFGRVEETSPEAWREMLDMNATTAFLCCRAAVPRMASTGGGSIVNVSAKPAVERAAGASMSAYGAAKAAVLNLTESLAHELAGAGINVNAVVPTIIDTPGNRAAMPEQDPSGWLDPRDIARVIRFLVGEPAGIVTGAALTMAVTRPRRPDPG